MSQTELVEYARHLQALQQKLKIDGPRNDDELHAWVLETIGVDIPRVSVCENHQPPFEFLADLYFERTDSALLMANRGGSKTFLVAILHLVNSKYKPGIEGLTIGAIEAQAKRCYSHLQLFLTKSKEDDVATTKISETIWKNGSKVEIVPGTMAAVNGPHCQVVHADEAELMDPAVYDESRNISQSKRLPDGRLYRSQDVITSTRKRAHGLMQSLLDEIQEAKQMGLKPPYELYVWCIFDTAAKVENCQVANPDLPKCDQCECDTVVKGRWEDGKPRTFASVCKGRLGRSAGWLPLDDLINTFTKSSRDIWEAQQECVRPSTEGLVIPTFARTNHCILKYDPLPELGTIYMAVDWGGTNPHAVNWYQVLDQPTEVLDYFNNTVVVEAGSVICFDEIYRANIGNIELAELVIKREDYWRSRHTGWRVAHRFPDVANKGARIDWAKHDPPLHTSFFVTRQVDEHIKKCRALVEDDRFYVAADRCTMFVEEIEAWHYPERKPGMKDDPDKPVDDFNHCMSNFRYGITNILHLQWKAGKIHSVPGASRHEYQPIRAIDQSGQSLPASTKGNNRTILRSEQWRRQFGLMGSP